MGKTLVDPTKSTPLRCFRVRVSRRVTVTGILKSPRTVFQVWDPTQPQPPPPRKSVRFSAEAEIINTKESCGNSSSSPPGPQSHSSLRAKGGQLDEGQCVQDPTQGDSYPNYEYESPGVVQNSELLTLLPHHNLPLRNDLRGCKEPLTSITTLLTTPSMVKGLERALEARDVRTIGDLSSLSPMRLQWLNLPIRSPRLQVVERVLQAHSCHCNSTTNL